MKIDIFKIEKELTSLIEKKKNVMLDQIPKDYKRMFSIFLLEKHFR